jgi:acyl-CoA dehydrogenase
MVNGSRFGVALMGLGIARRSFLEATIWAHHRRAKGRVLVDLPLIREQLVDMLVELEAAFALGFECAAAARAADGGRLRRILVPAAKVRLCRFGVEAASQAVELHGGNGYCEDWPLTRQLRDAQCHPIWEGTEQICELDVLRAIRRDNAHEAAFARMDRALDTADSGPDYAAEAIVATIAARNELERRIEELPPRDADLAEARAARITNLLVHTAAAALLLEQADDPHKALVGLRYAHRNLSPGAAWEDSIASVAGRELLAFDDLDHATAEKAAA